MKSILRRITVFVLAMAILGNTCCPAVSAV